MGRGPGPAAADWPRPIAPLRHVLLRERRVLAVGGAVLKRVFVSPPVPRIVFRPASPLGKAGAGTKVQRPRSAPSYESCAFGRQGHRHHPVLRRVRVHEVRQGARGDDPVGVPGRVGPRHERRGPDRQLRGQGQRRPRPQQVDDGPRQVRGRDVDPESHRQGHGGHRRRGALERRAPPPAGGREDASATARNDGGRRKPCGVRPTANRRPRDRPRRVTRVSMLRDARSRARKAN